jgi:hypothetical protein
VETCAALERPLPVNIIREMKMNVLIDFFIGLVPFVGDLADMLYRCNTRNAILLENELIKRAQSQDAGRLCGINSSSAIEHHDEANSG